MKRNIISFSGFKDDGCGFNNKALTNGSATLKRRDVASITPADLVCNTPDNNSSIM